MGQKKARERRKKWLQSPDGQAYMRSLMERTPEDAAAVEKILREAAEKK